jgi:hypothetical protein
MSILLFVEWHRLRVDGFSGIAVVAASITDETRHVTLAARKAVVSNETGRRFPETAAQCALCNLAFY